MPYSVQNVIFTSWAQKTFVNGYLLKIEMNIIVQITKEDIVEKEEKDSYNINPVRL